MRSSLHLALFAAASLVLASPVSAALTNYWAFSETSGTVIDAVGGLNGTPAGGVVQGVPGPTPVQGRAISLDGVDDAVNLGTTTALNFGSNFTVAAWIKPDTARNNMILSSGSSGWGFRTNPSSGLTFTTYGIQDFNSAANIVQNNVWQHVAVTFNSAFDATYFVNGVQQGATVLGASPANPSGANPWFLGSSAFGGVFRTDGSIDEVRVYNQVLTVDQLSLLANPKNISLGKQYAYSVLPRFSGGTFYLDDTHVQTANVFSTGQLTDALTFVGGSPTAVIANELVGWGDPATVSSAITFDLAGQFNIEGAIIGTSTFAQNANGAPDSVLVEFSLDGINFSGAQFASFAAPPTDGHFDFNLTFSNKVAQFVRFTFDGGAVLTGGTGNKWMLDEITILGALAVPEPASMMLMGLGGLALLRRRRQTETASA